MAHYCCCCTREPDELTLHIFPLCCGDADIHLPVTDAAATTALAASAYLHSKLKDDEIDFIATDTPHITLYLTVWQCTSPSPSTAECIESIKEAVDKTVKEVLAENQGACELTLTNPYAQGKWLAHKEEEEEEEEEEEKEEEEKGRESSITYLWIYSCRFRRLVLEVADSRGSGWRAHAACCLGRLC